MPILQTLSSLALKQFVAGAAHLAGLKVGENAVDGASKFLAGRFVDHSTKLPLALQRANDRAWKAIEVALAGDSILSWFDRADDKAFKQQVRTFLSVTPLAGLTGHGPEFCQVALRELRAARKSNLLTSGTLDPDELVRQTATFARFANPQSILDAELAALAVLGDELRQAGHPTLAHLVVLRGEAPGSVPLLLAGVRFFFRREVETDPELFQGLAWAKLEAVHEAGDAALAALEKALAQHADEIETMLAEVQRLVIETHGAVLDVHAEQRRQGGQLDEIYQAVLELKRRHDLPPAEVRPRDSLVIGNDSERRLVRAIMEKFRALPEGRQRQLPALLNSLAQLEVAAGDFGAAQRDFQEVAALVDDRAARAEAHHNAYLASLEKGDWAAALEALREAAALEPARFAPFPLTKYEPERILGAGGFGVAFLCRNRHSGSRVVVKTLRAETLDRQVSDVFREARVLEELEHPAIIRLRDCDYADATLRRPYLVMDYFDGLTLAEHVEKHGTLRPEELVALARPVAEALRAAHARGILHRDVKPANLLVRRDGDGWRVKLIDFGLALKQSVLTNTLATASAGSRSATTYSLAGTLDYAAPEQMGKLPGAAVGPYTDVYGFGKTSCHALFKTAQPLRKHWRDVPEGLADLLEQCLHESPSERLPSFDALLEGLSRLERPGGAGGQPAPPRLDPSQVPVTVVPPTGQPSGPDQGFGWLLAAAQAGAVQGAERGRQEPEPAQARERWWAEPGGGQLACLEGHEGPVLAVAFGPSGREVLTGGADGTVRLWEAETGRELACMYGHGGDVWAVCFTPDGKRALSAGKDRSVRQWDLATGRQKRSFEARTNRTVALSPDGSLALSGSVSDGMVRLWEADTGRELRRFKGHMSWVLAAAFGPDGRLAITGSADGTARLWAVESGRELRRLQGHRDQVLTVALSPLGQQALSGGADGTVQLWDLKSGKSIATLDEPTEPVYTVAFSPDGRCGAWGAADGSVMVRDLGRSEAVQRLKGHSGGVMCVAFSSDGRVAVSGGNDGAARLWGLGA